MRFGPLPVQAAEGSILAHSVAIPGGRLRKGQVLGPSEIALLHAAGLSEITVATLEPGDVTEDEAAETLARALLPQAETLLYPTRATTGRVNLKAKAAGLLEVNASAVHALNRLDPAITLATLAPLTRVSPGLLCATVKIITYAVAGRTLSEACRLAQNALRIIPVQRRTAGLILSETPDLDPKLARKGQRAIEARLHALGITLVAAEKVPHDEAAMAAALTRLPGEMALILAGSATSDLRDTAPNAVRLAGGHVARFGMPVDPGNLLFHGTQAGRPVIGLPGCARSPALNGADWVLERFACGLDPSDDDIAAMGLGGLLKEIPLRGRLREAEDGASD